MERNLEHTKSFPFRSLPPELRLRILEHTHLGPHDLGGYDANHERLLIHPEWKNGSKKPLQGK